MHIKGLIIILILFCIYNLFFINKAIHIDDYLTTISISRAIEKNFIAPLRFYNHPEKIKKYYLSSINLPVYNPIFLGYYYFPWISLFGEEEVILHILYIPFIIISLISMYFLSRRFTKEPILSTLFLIISPAFVVMSQSLKSNVPFLGFFLASLFTFIKGIDEDNRSMLLFSGIFSSIAILIEHTGLLLIPILLFYSLISSKTKGSLYLLFPIAVYVGCSIYTFIYYGEEVSLYLCDNLLTFAPPKMGVKVVACLSFLTGGAIFPIFLLPYYISNNRTRGKNLIAIFSLSLGVVPFLFNIRNLLYKYSLGEKVMLAVFFVTSIYIILFILRIGFKSIKNKKTNKDYVFLSFWFLIMLLVNFLIAFSSVRYILLLLPPFCLIVTNKLLNKLNLKVLVPIIIATFSISTIIAIGDYHFAGIYRDFMYKIKEKPQFKNSKVYFLPGDWGYNYYVRKAGFNFLTLKKLNRGYLKRRENKNSIFIISPHKKVVSYADQRKKIINMLKNRHYSVKLIDSYKYFGRITIHNKKWHTGFYSHDWGLFPFRFFINKKMIENFKIYRLS